MEIGLLVYPFIFISTIYVFRKWIRGPIAFPKCMNGKFVIVTGSSSGIGKQTAFELLKNGATVIFACRDEKKTLSVIEQCRKIPNDTNNSVEPFERAVFMKLDLCSFSSVKSFVEDYKKKFVTVDILINNAGYIANKFEISEDGLEKMIQTNHYSHVMLTLLLIDYFNRFEARIINVSALGHKFSDFHNTLKSNFPKDKDQYKNELNSSFKNKFIVYCNTKLANIYFSQYLVNYLMISNRFKNIKVFSCHPGIAETEIMRFLSNKWYVKILLPIFRFFLKSDLDGAQTQLNLCYEDINKLNSGGYYSDCKLSSSSKYSKNKELQDFLMSETNSVIREFLETTFSNSINN